MGRAGSWLAAGAAGRAEKTAQRTARRSAKGVAKARRESGLDPNGTPKSQLGQGSAAQKRALRRSAVRHGARLAGSAAMAGGVGLVSGLWNIKRPGKALGHMRTVWQRLAGRARRVRDKRDAAIQGTTPKGQVAVPDSTVNNPRRQAPRAKAPVLPGRGAAPITLGRTDHSGGTVSTTGTPAFTRLSDAAEVMLQAASTFDPEHMTEFQALIDDLPNAIALVMETLRVLAELSDEKLPVDPRVVEEMGQGYRAMNKVLDAMEDLGDVYRRVHAEDIERNENPRKGIAGERRWNVG
ncbi:hypothetical protein [Streptomyces sp. NPDC048057]|uniref:hypothetical protein n=1 Tax=Streptomyces sp. NPDC048057 TaxID=3155628 RepID=UPI0033BFDF9A